MNNIDSQIFNKDDQRTEDLHLQLSEKYMIYKDLADRCIINPNVIDKGDHRVFYIKPETVFSQEPRLQNQFRNDFIKQVSAPPVPEPFTLLADDIYKQMLDDIQDQSSAQVIREKLNKFFQRRQFLLQHKKHKYLSRWSHFALTSELVDKVSLNFRPTFTKLQFELEQAVKRHQRLNGEDHFDSDARPQRVEPSGQINPEDIDIDQRALKHSSLRIDDIDIFTRLSSYETICNRPIEKFINRAKWVPLNHRSDVYSQSQERVFRLKKQSIESQKAWLKRIEAKGLYLVDHRKLGETGYKELQHIKSSMQFLKQERKVKSLKDEYIQTSNFNHEVPPMICWNQVELKLGLEDLCQTLGVLSGTDMEVDDGNTFSFAVFVSFPDLFEKQAIKTQFAPYEAVPQMLKPSKLNGVNDYEEVLKVNLKKYGKLIPVPTLIEQMEIEADCSQQGIKYTNQIEKALFGSFNNGQSSFPKVRLLKAHWLPYICFKAELMPEQMQQAALLSSEQNLIDQVAIRMMEIVNINDLFNVTQTLESLSQIHYDKVRNGKVRQEFLNLDRSESETIFSEEQRSFYLSFLDCIKLKSDFQLTPQQDDNLLKNSLFDTTQHLLFADYLMTLLTARNQKTKLLYTLNAFRSIQKRIALELRELASRDRVSVNVTVVQPKGEKPDQQLYSNVVEATPVEATLTDQTLVLWEMVDINKYRFKGSTQTQMWSTCPVLPKFHIAYGEPIQRQEASAEFEVNKDADPRKGMSQRLLGRIDHISEYEDVILVADDFGVNIMYDASFADMRVLEKEMLKIMSYFINKLEPMQDQDFRTVFPAVDRFKLVQQILQCEQNYQRAKLNLCFSYLECYEHTCDTLEQQRLIQLIVDLQAKRPRINLAATHFVDSYNTEIKVFETQLVLMKEFIQMQMHHELQCNSQIRESLEKTYRLIYEQSDNKWQYYESQDIPDEHERRKINAVGLEDGADNQEQLEKVKQMKPGMFKAKEPTVNINQFAEMLGMPLRSLQMLLKDHAERDPLIKQSIHEHVSFIKLQEGYPVFFTDTEISKNNKVQVVPNGTTIGMLEIFESLSQAVKIQAAVYHSVSELHSVHQPDNGLVSSMQNLITVEFMLAELRAVRAELRGDQAMQARDLDVIEDMSILGNPEKMLFFIKELSAAAEDPNLIQNPFVLTKIDMQTLVDFDFDSVQSKKFRKKGAKQEEHKQEETTEEHDEEESDADDFAKKQKLHERQKDKGYPRLRARITRPNIPSQLEICCNAIEVMRLKHQLVLAYHQRTCLVRTFQQQCLAMNKEAKVHFQDSFNFETHMSGGDNWKNFVDTGPGMDTFINTGLSVKEFDPSLTAVLNFADPEAFKALVCPLGLEELRVVVRYELVNLQLLVVAVRHNQVLLDTGMRQLAEIELFEKGQLVTAPSLDLLSKLTNLTEAHLKKIPEAERRQVQQRLNEKVGRCTFSIIAKKLRPKDTVETAYKRIRQAVIDRKFEKVEVGLRHLRTSRIMLCHDYCEDVQSQIYLDSLRTELFYEVNSIRKRAYLLPRDLMIHKVPLAKYGEHTYAAYNEENYQSAEQECEFWDPVRKEISNFYQLPDFWEIFTIQADLDEFKSVNSQGLYVYDDQTILDSNHKQVLKSKLPTLRPLDLQNAELTLKSKGRYVDFQEAPSITNQRLYKYLFYFRQLQNLFDLEYFKNKLSTRANSIATLEQCVMSGLPFWETLQEPMIEASDDDKPSQEFKNKLAEQIIIKMQVEKKNKVQLITELDSIKETFDYWAQRMSKLTLKGDLTESAQFLSEQVQSSYYNILAALYAVRELYIKQSVGQKEIASINELLSLFSHTDDSKVTYINGYHVNQATTQISRISLDTSCHRPDYQNFFLATLPVIDEQGLNPTEFNLVRGMYTSDSTHLKSYRRMKPYLGYLPARDFSCLDFKLLNVQRDVRKYIVTYIQQSQDVSLEYAHSKLKIEPALYQYNWNNQLEVLSESKQFIRHQIRANRLKQTLMVLMTKKLLPHDVKELSLLFKEFTDMFQWKVMTQNDQTVKSKAKKDVVKVIQAGLHSVTKPKVNAVTQQYDTVSCEIDVYQQEIQKYMIMTSLRLIDRETTSLCNAFEINGKRLEVIIGVHQQFAATMDPEDKRNHLDIVQKVAPVQKMLTQMKNRMLVTKALTGGEGFTIRGKDLTLILEDLCRSIVKTGEIEMKTRCADLIQQIDFLQQMMYAKDQQIMTLESKLQYAADELSKIVSTKIFAKGNSVIFELDHTQRQLRLVKDNIFQMETRLHDAVRIDFEKDLQEARLALQEERKKFESYQQVLNASMNTEIKEHINELDLQLKKIINKDPRLNHYDEAKPAKQLQEEYSHLLNKKQPQSTGVESVEPLLRELERLKRGQKEAHEEVLEMQNLIRKQRMLRNFKQIVAQRKNDLKIENLKQQLTSNQSLWEQLAESEKRERVLKQELLRTQSQVATLEKVLERLKDEIKYEQLESNKLSNFKDSQMKRLGQLEDQSKAMEIMQQIDIDKVVNVLGRKEREVELLKSQTQQSKEVIQKIYLNRKKEVQESQKLVLRESQVKMQVLGKLDRLKMEVDVLRGGAMSSLHMRDLDSRFKLGPDKPYSTLSQKYNKNVRTSLPALKKPNIFDTTYGDESPISYLQATRTTMTNDQDNEQNIFKSLAIQKP